MKKSSNSRPIGLIVLFFLSLIALVSSGFVSYAAENNILPIFGGMQEALDDSDGSDIDGMEDGEENSEDGEESDGTGNPALPSFDAVSFGLPIYSHTDRYLTVKTHYIKASDAQWSLTDANGSSVDMNDVLDGSLDDKGGVIRFMKDGDYTLTATATDNSGQEQTYSKSIRIYPVPHIVWDLPRDIHVDESMTFDTEEDNPDFSDKASNDNDNSSDNENTDGDEEETETFSLFPFADDDDEDGEEEGDNEEGDGFDTGDGDNNNNVGSDSFDYEWVVENTYDEVNWSDYINGEITGTQGNSLQFKEPGVYEIVAKTSDETGRDFIVRTGKRITVHPVLDLSFSLPEEAFTEADVTISLSGDNKYLPAVWTLVRDEQPAVMSECFNGTLNSTGGTIQFIKPGRYEFTATLTDVTGRQYKHTEKMVVHPDVTYVPAIDKMTSGIRKHLGQDFEIEIIEHKNLEWVSVQWRLEDKDSKEISPANIINGTDKLAKMGGGTLDFLKDAVSTPADYTPEDSELYTFVAHLEDDYGWSMEASVSATAWNEAPNKPSIDTNELNWNDVRSPYTTDAKIKNIVKTSSSDAWPADSIKDILYDHTYETDGFYLPQGDFIYKVRAVDNWGKVSEWSDIPMSVHAAPPTIKLSSGSIDSNGLSKTGNVSVKGDTTCSTPGKVSVIDFFHTMVNRTVFDARSLTGGYDVNSGPDVVQVGYDAPGHSVYPDTGRHLLVAQIMDIFANTDYDSLFFVIGNSVASGNGKVTTNITELLEEGIYTDDDRDRQYPLAWINGFTFNVPECSGHNGADWISVRAKRESGTWDTLVSETQATAYNAPFSAEAKAPTGGSWSAPKSGNSGTFPFPSNTYVQMEFKYQNNHDSCLRTGNQSLVYSTYYTFKNDDRTMDILKKLFE